MVLYPDPPSADALSPSPRTLFGSALSSFKSLPHEVLSIIFLSFDFESLEKFSLVSCHTKETCGGLSVSLLCYASSSVLQYLADARMLSYSRTAHG